MSAVVVGRIHNYGSYRQRLMEKLELAHRSELVDYALKQGLLS